MGKFNTRSITDIWVNHTDREMNWYHPLHYEFISYISVKQNIRFNWISFLKKYFTLAPILTRTDDAWSPTISVLVKVYDRKAQKAEFQIFLRALYFCLCGRIITRGSQGMNQHDRMFHRLLHRFNGMQLRNWLCLVAAFILSPTYIITSPYFVGLYLFNYAVFNSVYNTSKERL
jgi:hypothetical protein